jgi:MFS family permease
VKEFQVSQTQAGGLVCFNVFTFGLGNIFWVPLMRVVGKRPVYLLALLALCLLNVWTSKANSYGELLASRVCSGFAAAAGDATVPAVVADLVNPRDRGHYMMFFHFAMTTGLFVGPLFNSFLVEYRNWRWMCDLVAIVAGVLFVVAFFTIRETSYLESRVTDSSRYTKRSQWQWMSLKWGYNRDASYIQAVWDILTLAAYPQLIWCAITIGVSVGWYVQQ